MHHFTVCVTVSILWSLCSVAALYLYWHCHAAFLLSCMPYWSCLAADQPLSCCVTSIGLPLHLSHCLASVTPPGQCQVALDRALFIPYHVLGVVYTIAAVWCCRTWHSICHMCHCHTLSTCLMLHWHIFIHCILYCYALCAITYIYCKSTCVVCVCVPSRISGTGRCSTTLLAPTSRAPTW